MPDGHGVLLHVVVDGQIRRLVHLSGLQYQHLWTNQNQAFGSAGHTAGDTVMVCVSRSDAQGHESKPARTYGEADGGHVLVGGLHQDVHPEVHQLLLRGGLLPGRLLEMLVDQDSLHQRAQVPGVRTDPR